MRSADPAVDIAGARREDQARALVGVAVSRLTVLGVPPSEVLATVERLLGEGEDDGRHESR